MTDDNLFYATENKALMAICTRKLITNIGIGGIIWGVMNTALGVISIQVSLINIGLVILGIIMLGTGAQAIRRPSLGVLMAETIVAIILFLWNLGISFINFQATGTFEPQGLVFPLIIAAVLANYYRKLGHLREQISSVDPEMIKTTKQMCKKLLKKKLKSDPSVVQTTDRKCRAQLMDEKAFFVQRDLLRAFIGSKEDIQNAISKPDAKSLKLHFDHPVAKLKYQFDKKNSEKLNSWLSVGVESAT